MLFWRRCNPLFHWVKLLGWKGNNLTPSHYNIVVVRSANGLLGVGGVGVGLTGNSLKLKFTIRTTDVNIGETWIPKSEQSAMIFAFKIEHEQLEYVGLVTQREFGNDRTSFVSQIIILAKGWKSIAQLFVEIQPLNKTKRNE